MKAMKLKIAILSAFTLAFGTLKAQDVHFSAMDYSPMTINPAMAGAKYHLQATANYRNQWSAVATPYQTVGAGFDMRFGNKKQHGDGFLALGVNFNNDNVGENQVISNNMGISVAYHLKINTEHTLGLGIQGGFGQRSLNHNNGQWGNQYNGSAYDANLPTGENIDRASFSFFDASAGMVYTYKPFQTSRKNNGMNLNIGLAAFHLNQPKYSFIKDTEELYVRGAVFAMAEFGIANKPMAIEPQIVVQFQGPSLETFIGTDYRFFLGQGTSMNGFYDGTSLAVGMFYRNRDALITRFSVRFGGIDAGLAYDFNVFSSLTQTSRGRGGVEVYLRYIINSPSNTTRARI